MQVSAHNAEPSEFSKLNNLFSHPLCLSIYTVPSAENSYSVMLVLCDSFQSQPCRRQLRPSPGNDTLFCTSWVSALARCTLLRHLFAHLYLPARWTVHCIANLQQGVWHQIGVPEIQMKWLTDSMNEYMKEWKVVPVQEKGGNISIPPK